MKNLKYITIALAVLVGFTSCQDAYNIEPIGILDEEATFFEVDDAQTYLNGVYGTVQNTVQIGFTAIFTDELAPSADWNGSNEDLHQFILQSTSGHASAIWLNGHAAVNRVNRLLSGAELLYNKIEDPAEIDQLNDIVAQGRYLRAYAYLSLLSYFSPDMTDNNALGAMLFTDVPESDATLPRATNGEIYQLIEEDLNFAFTHLHSHSFIYPTKAAVDALRARMYAYRGDYGNAATYANKVITQYGLSLTPAQPFDLNNFYKPSSTNPYRQIWSNLPIDATEQHEQIFTLQSLKGGVPNFQPAGIFYQNSTSCNGSPLWTMGYNVWAMLQPNADDVRTWAWTDPSSFKSNDLYDYRCNDGEIMIDKYPGLGSGDLLSNNLVLLRLTEMYFIMAEANAENNPSAAASYIHDIREARSVTGSASMPSYNDPQSAWRDILKERRIELYGEGFRYVDLRRLRHKANVSLDRNAKDNSNPNVALTLPLDDHRWTLPVPLNEIMVNPNIVQNPGY